MVDSQSNSIFEQSDEGSDRILSTVSYALASGQEIEKLQLLSNTGAAALNLDGNEISNTLVGNDGANILRGLGGSDAIIAGKGNDTLEGGAGNDSLDGGLGMDILQGQMGTDRFVFTTAPASNNIDRIVDFTTGNDGIRLSRATFAELEFGELKATQFKDIAAGALDADDRILYESSTGKLFYDADGSGVGARVQFASVDNSPVVKSSDFYVI